MHKRIIIIIVMVISNLGIIKAQWSCEKSPTKDDLNSIFLFNDNSGWIVGDKGTMLYKVNEHWIENERITVEDIYSVFMLNTNDGWAVGARGTILHFNGKMWTNVESPTKRDLYAVSFRDPEHGLAVGLRGTILVYANGTWSSVPTMIRGNFYAASYNGELSFIGGGHEGKNLPIIGFAGARPDYTTGTFVPYNLIRSISRTRSNQAWAVGPNAVFHFNGESWQRIGTRKDTPSLINVFFSNEANGICVGCEGSVLLYSEGEWAKQEVPSKKHLRGSSISEKAYYAVGDEGTILKMDKVADKTESLQTRNNVLTLEIFPNPCDSFLRILIPDSNVFIIEQITVTNLYGTVMMKMKTNSGMEGDIITLDTGNLSKGLYLISAQSVDGRVASAKFTVSR